MKKGKLEKNGDLPCQLTCNAKLIEETEKLLV